MKSRVFLLLTFFIFQIAIHAQEKDTSKSFCKTENEFWSEWAPDPKHLDHMPIKYVPVYLHFIRDDTCGNNFDDQTYFTAENYAKDLEASINLRLEQNVVMKAPIPENCASEHIGDSRIRIKVMGVHYEACDENCNNYDGEPRQWGHPCECFAKYNVNEEKWLNIYFMEDGVPEKRRGGEAYRINACKGYYRPNPESDFWARPVTKWTTGIRIEGLWGILKSKDWGVWQANNVVMHELGHIIGLLAHPWISNDFAGRPPYDCCDTPLGRSSESNNQMDYGMGDRGFTHCQIGFIHKNLMEEYAPYLLDDYCTYDKNETIIVDEKEKITWNTPRYLKGDLVIKSGSSLEVNCTLGMPKDARIRVEAGGKLILNGSKITNVCGEKWIGIEVHRDIRFDKNDPKSEGLLEVLNDAQIENSEVEVFELDVVKGRPARQRQIRRFEKKRAKVRVKANQIESTHL